MYFIQIIISPFTDLLIGVLTHKLLLKAFLFVLRKHGFEQISNYTKLKVMMILIIYKLDIFILY